jgi:hypothetical protein
MKLLRHTNSGYHLGEQGQLSPCVTNTSERKGAEGGEALFSDLRNRALMASNVNLIALERYMPLRGRKKGRFWYMVCVYYYLISSHLPPLYSGTLVTF